LRELQKAAHESLKPSYSTSPKNRAKTVQRLKAMRGPGESYSDVILQLVKIEAGNQAR
jgi:hypothetical protein